MAGVNKTALDRALTKLALDAIEFAVQEQIDAEGCGAVFGALQTPAHLRPAPLLAPPYGEAG